MYCTACICPSMVRLFLVNLAVRMGHAFFHVFDDSRHEVIDEEATEYILQFILADLLRGLVCGVPSNTLRGLFIYL